jgi:DNA polymerase-1
MVQGSRRYWVPLTRLLDVDASCEEADLWLIFSETVFAHCHVVFQDAKWVQRALLMQSLSPVAHCFDVTVMAYAALGPDRLDLPGLAVRFLGRDDVPSRDDLLGKGAKRLLCEQMSQTILGECLIDEASLLSEIFTSICDDVWAQDAAAKRIYQDVDGPLIAILAKMEHHGALLDTVILAEQSEDLASKLDDLNAEAYRLAGQTFNTASVKQLQAILFDQLGLPVLEKTPKGDPSTSESVLAMLGEQFVLPKTILEIRSLSKLKSTYVDALPKLAHAQRVHCHFQQTVTSTGRLSCQNPNLQNIPIRTEAGRAVRKAFIAPEGFQLVAFDYSQIELRIMAHISGDQTLKEAFLTGQDVHQRTAAELFSMSVDEVGPQERRVAKVINFGLIYGMSAFGLAKQLGVDRVTAQAYIDRYFERYPGVKAYMESVRKRAGQDGYVETVLGRKIYFPDIKHAKATVRKAAERAAINAPMQGTAAELIKLSMLAVGAWMQDCPLDIFMTIQVHDELVFEIKSDFVDTAVAKITAIMESVHSFDVPLVVNAKRGQNWADA